ncbi:putative prophage protein [Escherichia coli]|uniref:Prophage protein n=2 Tax=Escherichia coli TaxID=562 RepID=A0AB38GU39_ECOLX|nr:hypothetical protein [Escherichia coli]EHU16818.1 hypothetical protein ECDEC1B_1530 [Escherichia coli DEC1B]EHU47270.1 hypothetical protein ECDEC2C_1419 [Escherichia coli DEC2C]EHU61033.1 hypothetical protein ECDEC2E_1478 [Escherichia coli DEC2E]EFR16869.1 gp46 domain protein [Escherichia coli 2362-75]EHU11845.1 hypothetical protein ECDEC1A_1376 [Escherichia coli DEC1A]
MNEIKEIPVVRDEYGCWTHPEYEKFCDGREYISTEEFNAWMEENNLQYVLCFRDEGCADLDACDADISAWEPERPEGNGWFIGSIHDTEDGPVCVWLRNKVEA